MKQMNQVQQRQTEHLKRFFQHQPSAIVVHVQNMKNTVQWNTAHQRAPH